MTATDIENRTPDCLVATAPAQPDDELSIPAYLDRRALPTTLQVFDYTAVSPNAAIMARDLAAKVRRHQHRVVAEIIEIGTDLSKVKVALGHGLFSRWLDAEFGWSGRTARNYMSAAEVFGTKTETVSGLPAATVYLLAAPSTPPGVRADVIRRLEHGERPAAAEIVDQIREAKAAVRLVRQEARLTAGQRRYRAKTKAARDDERERWQQQEAAERAKARAIAQSLINIYGATVVVAIVEAVDKHAVADAVRELVCEGDAP
jgi:hypothetical protein